MKMGNVVSRAGIEPTSYPFQAKLPLCMLTEYVLHMRHCINGDSVYAVAHKRNHPPDDTYSKVANESKAASSLSSVVAPPGGKLPEPNYWSTPGAASVSHFS